MFCHRTHKPLPITDFLPHGGTFLTIHEPTLTHIHSLQGPQMTLGSTLVVEQSVGLNKHIMTYIHHYSVIQSGVTGLKIL